MSIVVEQITRALQQTCIAVIGLYRLLISPLLGPRCRFYPSCSEYSQVAISKHGLIDGIKLTIKRLGRCHPLSTGGIDNVPDTLTTQINSQTNSCCSSQTATKLNYATTICSELTDPKFKH